jgi:YVTN family beta-propeller protein
MDHCVDLGMRLRHSGQAAAVVALIFLWSGCGDTFRPVAIPIPPTPPNPAATHFVVSLSGNGTSFPPANNTNPNLVPNAGASTRIDVSGDTKAGVARLGLSPVHAAVLPSGSAVYVANSLDDTVSTYSTSDSTKVTTISLGTGAKPVFVATAESGTVYVANAGANTVGAITVATNVMAKTVPLGFSPVALAETPDGKKVYAVGGSTGVVSINTADESLNAPVTDGGLNTPVWVVARSDSQRAYVLNQGGLLVTLDTATDAVVGSDVAVGAGANFMFYDPARNRLYIVNPSSTQVVVLNAAVDPPLALAPIDLRAVVGSTTPLCASGCIPTSVTALPDGSRVYIASYANTTVTDPVTQAQVPGTTVQITVFSTQTNSVKTLIPTNTTSSTSAILAELNTSVASGCSTSATVPTASVPSVRFRLFAAAAPDGTRVYMSNCDAGSTFVVRTSDDTLVPGQMINPQTCTPPPLTVPFTIPAPYSSFVPVPVACVGTLPPRQNPVFVLPEQ